MSNFYLTILVLIMTAMGAFASLFLKKAAEKSVNKTSSKALVERTSNDKSFLVLITNANFYLGGGLYFISALLNILLLKYLYYSVVLPITSLTYAWIILISGVFLKEMISFKQIFGVALICAGAVLVSL